MIDGRVASLLEVGTGFHPELTGRENVYLNGPILGMGRAEIRRKFDEIVAFAGVETFLDTPVKRYSSGMQVRLAFSVAAHLEPEILIIDEVLAVGDAEFQKKCLGKMDQVSQREGRTVLFVSHQLGTVARLCNRGILLAAGNIVFDGDSREAIEVYRRQLETPPPTAPDEASNSVVSIADVAAVDAEGARTTEFFFDEDIHLLIKLRGVVTDPRTQLSTTLVARDGNYVSTTTVSLTDLVGAEAKTHQVSVSIPRGIIAPNDYSFRLALFNSPSEVIEIQEFVAPIRIRDNGSPMAEFEGIHYGSVILPFTSRVVSHDP
jgi:lipopolysaccharide transport system ATP-binding protein